MATLQIFFIPVFGKKSQQKSNLERKIDFLSIIIKMFDSSVIANDCYLICGINELNRIDKRQVSFVNFHNIKHLKI